MLMTTFLQFTASRFLFLVTLIVTLFSGNAAQAWFPKKEDLEVMSLRSAIIVNVILLAVLAALTYLVVQLVLVAI